MSFPITYSAQDLRNAYNINSNYELKCEFKSNRIDEAVNFLRQMLDADTARVTADVNFYLKFKMLPHVVEEEANEMLKYFGYVPPRLQIIIQSSEYHNSSLALNQVNTAREKIKNLRKEGYSFILK